MTIRVDDDLGPELPDDPEFDFDGQIEFIITIEDDSVDADDSDEAYVSDADRIRPEVVDATDNLVIDDSEFELIDAKTGTETETDDNPDDETDDEPELQAGDDETEVDLDVTAEAEHDELEAEAVIETDVDDETELETEADLETETETETEIEAEIEADTGLELEEEELDEHLADEVEADEHLADEVVTDDVEAEVVQAEVVELRPDHETDLEFETVFLSEADGALPADGDLAHTNGHGPVVETPIDQVIEMPAAEDSTAAISETPQVSNEAAGFSQTPTEDVHPELVEESTMEVIPAAQSAGSTWSLARATSVAAPAMAAVLVLGAVGYAFGRLGGGEEVVRREFVYTLDESVPDSFLREDRRLLTQIVTIESDSVLAPVAEEFDLPIDDLRDKIEVETVDLSEVLRLEVSDESRTTALAISEAVIEQYLLVSSNPLPSERSSALRTQRDGVVADLGEADAALLALQQDRREDAQLATQEESLQRQIDLTAEHLNRLEGLIEDSLVSTLTGARRGSLETEKTSAELELVELEAQLATVRTERAQLAEQSAEESALGREVSRLEADLTTIDDELARRELGPLVASPVRALSEPSVLTVTAHRAGLQGLAGGVLLGIPIAGLVAYRVRKRQLWLD